MTDKPNKRTFLAPIDEAHGFTLPKDVVKAIERRSETDPEPPTTTAEWLEFTLQVLNHKIPIAPERTASLCQEVVRYVLQDAEEAESSRRDAQARQEYSGDGFSSFEESGDPLSMNETGVQETATKIAIEVLAARSMLGIEMDNLAESEVAQHLSRAAYEIDNTDPLAILAYAFASYHAGRRSIDRSSHHASSVLTMRLAEEGLELLHQKLSRPPGSLDLACAPGTTVPIEVRYAVRLAWLYCAAGGTFEVVKPFLFGIQQHCDSHFLLLLLIAVICSSDSGDEEAFAAALEQLENLYGDHIAVLAFAALNHRHRCRPPLPDGTDAAAKMIVTAIARVEFLSNGLFAQLIGNNQKAEGRSSPSPAAAPSSAAAATPPSKSSTGSAPTSTPKKAAVPASKQKGLSETTPSFQQLAAPDAPGEVTELQVRWRRTAMYWAFVAHVACRIGCYTITETCVEAGLTLLGAAPRFYPFAYADLLTTKVECMLCKWAEKHCGDHLAGTPSDPTSILQALIAAPLDLHQPLAALTGDWLLDAAEDGIAETDGNEDGEVNQDFVSSQNAGASNAITEFSRGLVLALDELKAFPQYLIKAIDADPVHAGAYYLFGYIKVLEGIYGDLPQEQRELIFAEGSHYLTQALHRNPGMGAASYALGCIHMAQGDSDSALNFFSSSLEASERSFLLPLERLMFLLER